MTNHIINLESVVKLGVMPELVMFALAGELSDMARAEWVRLAQNRLESSQRDYINGIGQVEEGDGYFSIKLNGAFPNIIEQGMSRTNLRDWFLDNPKDPSKVHQSEWGGVYRYIPFQHKSAGAKRSGRDGIPMGRAYKGKVDDFEKLGRRVHRQAKKLISASQYYAGVSGPRALDTSKMDIPKLKSIHKGDIYNRMKVDRQAIQKSDGSTGWQRHYTTFRTISSTVDPDRWWHPGIEPGKDLATDVVNFVQEQTPIAIGKIMEGLDV